VALTSTVLGGVKGTGTGTACAGGQYGTGFDAAGALLCGTPAGTYTLPDATSSVTGGLRLTGQLGGTATSPTVTGLTGAIIGVANHSATGTPGATTFYRGDNTWNVPAGTYTLPAASTTLGGTKMAAACGAGAHVSSIGAGGELTCSADAGGTYTLPAATASVLGGVKGTGAALVCSGTDKATGFDAAGSLQCAADQTGGAGSANAVSVSITFTGSPGVYRATATAGWVTSTTKLACSPQATTADGQTLETYYVAGFELTVANVVASTGFDLAVYSPRGVTGVFRFSCTGV
jgi:hypothetical protein